MNIKEAIEDGLADRGLLLCIGGAIIVGFESRALLPRTFTGLLLSWVACLVWGLFSANAVRRRR